VVAPLGNVNFNDALRLLQGSFCCLRFHIAALEDRLMAPHLHLRPQPLPLPCLHTPISHLARPCPPLNCVRTDPLVGFTCFANTKQPINAPHFAQHRAAMASTPFFWSQPLRYMRWASHEKPALFYSVVIGLLGPAIVVVVPPIRHRFGDNQRPQIPFTYPSESRLCQCFQKNRDLWLWRKCRGNSVQNFH
jgi:hypothetical protein